MLLEDVTVVKRLAGTAGGVVSGELLLTVTLTGADVVVSLAPSVAVAVKV